MVIFPLVSKGRRSPHTTSKQMGFSTFSFEIENFSVLTKIATPPPLLVPDWLLPIVQPFLDPCQFGLKGGSINHYLIKLLKFIHEQLDHKDPHAVAVALVDLSKAFNRVLHQTDV